MTTEYTPPRAATLHLGGDAWAHPDLEPLVRDLGDHTIQRAPSNPRLGDHEAIVESIRINGVYSPVKVQRSTGHVLAGNHTYDAITDQGGTRMPWVWLDVDDDEARRIMLADNRTAELGGYDQTLLLEQVRAAAAADQLLAGTGYSSDDLAELERAYAAANQVATLTDPDDLPALPDEKYVPITKRGDIWHLGDHRLLCGDATSSGDLIALMRDDVAAICFTSPPYNAGKNASLSPAPKDAPDNKYGEGYDDDRPPEEWLTMCSDATRRALDHAQYVIVNIQMLAGNKTALIDYLHHWRHELADIAVWDKVNAQPAMAENVMNSRFEFLLFITTRNPANRAIRTGSFRGTVPNVVQTASAGGQNAYADQHAATFPAALPTWAIENFTNHSDTVLDPFAGTGTTLIAAHDLGRASRLVELDPRYCDLICRRFQAHTGVQPIRDGKTVDFG